MSSSDHLTQRQFGPHMTKVLGNASDMYKNMEATNPAYEKGWHNSPERDAWSANQWGSIGIAHTISGDAERGAKTAGYGTQMMERSRAKDSLLDSAASGASAFDDDKNPFAHRGTAGDARRGKTS